MENIKDETLDTNTAGLELEEEMQNLEVDKNVIADLSANLVKQHNALVELLDTRLHQLQFFYANLKKYRLDEIISYGELEVIIVSANGLSINIEDTKTRVDKLNYTELFKKYDTYIAAQDSNDENIDLDILGAEIHDEMQSFFKDSESIGAILDVLTETYTTEVQIKLDAILRRIKIENDKLDILTDEAKGILDIDNIKDNVIEAAEEKLEEDESKILEEK